MIQYRFIVVACFVFVILGGIGSTASAQSQGGQFVLYLDHITQSLDDNQSELQFELCGPTTCHVNRIESRKGGVVHAVYAPQGPLLAVMDMTHHGDIAIISGAGELVYSSSGPLPYPVNPTALGPAVMRNLTQPVYDELFQTAEDMGFIHEQDIQFQAPDIEPTGMGGIPMPYPIVAGGKYGKSSSKFLPWWSVVDLPCFTYPPISMWDDVE